MRALDRLDRIDLHEAEILDQRQQVLVAQLAARRKAEALALQEQPPGRAVVDDASCSHAAEARLTAGCGARRRAGAARRGAALCVRSETPLFPAGSRQAPARRRAAADPGT